MGSSVSKSIDLFCLPEVQDLIFQQPGILSTRDLASAVLVNRLWYQIVSPFFWSHVRITQAYSRLENYKPGIIKNARWIRELETNETNLLAWLVASQDCRRLKSLSFLPRQSGGYESNDSSLIFVRLLLETNPEIQVLKWNQSTGLARKFSLLATDGSWLTKREPWMRLTSLDLRLVDLRGPELCLTLNQCSKSIKVLRIKDCVMESDLFSDLVPLLKLEQLCWEERDYIHGNVIYPFQAFEKLVSCTRQLSQLILLNGNPLVTAALPGYFQNRLSLVTSLKIKTLDRARWQDENATSFLESLSPNLLMLRVSGASFGPLSNQALSRLACFHTLTIAKFMDCSSMKAESWQAILSGCPLLINVHGDGYTPMDVMAVTEPWVCEKLEKFEMCTRVGYQSVEESNVVKSTEIDQLILKESDVLLTQLSKLPKLKKLAININSAPGTWKEGVENNGEAFDKAPGYRLSEDLMRMWSLLKDCKDLKYVRVRFFLPSRMVDLDRLRKQAGLMWGHQAWIRLDLCYS